MKKCVLILCVMLSFNAKADDEITIVAQTDPNDATTKCGDNCTWTLYSDGRLEISGKGDMYNFDQWQQDTFVYKTDWRTDSPWVDFSSSINEINIADGITSIGRYSFWDTAVTTASLPNSIKKVGHGAFQYSDLQQVNLPVSLEEISHAAFHESYVSDLVIPETVTSIGTHAFGSPSLKNLTIEGNVNINESMFHCDGGYAVSPLLNNIYCLSSNESCNALKTDVNIGSKITSYTKESGVYRLEDGTMFASPNDMMNGTNACSNLDSCKATVLKNKGYCTSDESCMAMVDLENANAPIEYKNKSYASIDDLLKGKYMPKRIYTIDEANAVAGKVNSVKIRYR